MTGHEREKKTQRALETHASLVHATESLAALQSDQLDALGLTMSQFRVLEALLHGGPMSQVALSERLLCGHSNTNFIAGKLYERGLIVRKAFQGDHRSTMIQLTAEGRKLIAKVFSVHATLVRAQMSVLEGREQETLCRLCQKLGRGEAAKFVRELVMLEAGEAGESA
jgi:MarR family 2-MHQ and catechol resistance regulon transcriptional repressor